MRMRRSDFTWLRRKAKSPLCTGLRGETPIDRAKAHMIVEMVTEMFEVIIKNHFEKDEAKKARDR